MQRVAPVGADSTLMRRPSERATIDESEHVDPASVQLVVDAVSPVADAGET